MNRGNVDSAYSALVSGCAIVDQPHREWLVVSGEDQVRFVNGLVTCEIRELGEDGGVYGFFVSPQGRILADVVVTGGEQALLLDLPPGRGETITEHMLRYKVADRVAFAMAEVSPQIVVAGPQSVASLEQLLGESLIDGRWSHQHLGPLSLHREHRLGVPATRVFGPREDVEELLGRLEGAGAVRVETDVVSAARVERGVPWCDVDFGEENFPQETGLESEAVSYTKGCYLGQEIVARIHYRGQVNRGLRGLRGSDSAIEVGSELFSAGEKVGEVTSAVFSPALGAPIALAMVHRKAQEGVDLVNGVRLPLVELPFVS